MHFEITKILAIGITWTKKRGPNPYIFPFPNLASQKVGTCVAGGGGLEPRV